MRSKKLTVFAAVLILFAGIFIGGYLVLKSGKISADQLEQILQGKSYSTLSCNPDSDNANKDSDGDGLKDWEELQLYGTNPCKQDSDGDGYLDGEEVASGYDPAKKAPGDELPGTTPKTPRPLPQNLTKALSSMLSQQMMAGKIDSFTATGQVLSTEELEKYPGLQKSVEQIIDNSALLFTPEIIADSQIPINPDSGPVAVKKYAADSSSAIYPDGISNEKQGIDELSAMLEEMEAGGSQDLSIVLNKYQSAYERLKKISVPAKLFDFHQEQLQIISRFIKIFEAVKSGADDPLKTYLAIQSYQDNSIRLENWLIKLTDFLSANY